MGHDTTIAALGEGAAQARCSCGWSSEVFGIDKGSGTMDAWQHAEEARDFHVWDASLR